MRESVVFVILAECIAHVQRHVLNKTRVGAPVPPYAPPPSIPWYLLWHVTY